MGAFATATDGSIIGNERDLQLVVVSGASNLLMTAGVANGNFQCATPDGAQGYSTVQWDGADASFNLTLPGGESTNEFELEFSGFTSGCDFSSVGAIEMVVQQRPQPVDVTVELFTVLGPIPQTPTPTRTPTPVPSNSATPSRPLLLPSSASADA